MGSNDKAVTIAVPKELTEQDRKDRLAISTGTPIGKMLAALPIHKLNLLRNQYAANTTIEEFELYLEICAHRGLSPFANQVYCIVRGRDKNRKATMQVSLAGLLSIAARSKEFAGVDEARFGPMIDALPAQNHPRGILNDVKHPESATVTVYRYSSYGRASFTQTIRWDEFVPMFPKWREDENGNNRKVGDAIGDMWEKMPCHMSGKCATAGAVRLGFSETAGLYIPEEMQSEDARLGYDPVNIVDSTAELQDDLNPVPPQRTTHPVPSIPARQTKSPTTTEPEPQSAAAEPKEDPELVKAEQAEIAALAAAYSISGNGAFAIFKALHTDVSRSQLLQNMRDCGVFLLHLMVLDYCAKNHRRPSGVPNLNQAISNLRSAYDILPGDYEGLAQKMVDDPELDKKLGVACDLYKFKTIAAAA